MKADEPVVTSKRSAKPRSGFWVDAWVVLAFASVWSAMILFFCALFGRDLARQIRTMDFASVPGEIVESSAVDGDEDSSSLVVRYKYTVSGRAYFGDKVRFGAMSGDRSWTHGMAAVLQAGTDVPIHYDRADPTISVLYVGLDGVDLLALQALTPFALVAVFLWAWGFENVRKGRGRPARVRILREMDLESIDLGGLRPGAVGLLATFVAAFAGTFVVGFLLKGTATLAPMVLVWSTIILVGFGAAGWVRVRIRRGHGQITIDAHGRRLLLPADRKTGRREAVGIGDIAGVNVASETRVDGEGDERLLYRVRLLSAHPESPHRDVGEWGFKPDAEAVAGWLRGRLGFGDENSDA